MREKKIKKTDEIQVKWPSPRLLNGRTRTATFILSLVIVHNWFFHLKRMTLYIHCNKIL